MRAYVTWAMGVIVCFVCFLLLRMLFVAPFQMYREQKKEKERAQREVHDLVNGETPDLLFGDDQRRGHPDYVTEKIRAWGQPPRIGTMLPLASTPVRIPHQFFYDPNYGPTEDDGNVFEISTSLPGWSDWREHESYLNVMVNRGQIVAAFSNKTDPNK